MYISCTLDFLDLNLMSRKVNLQRCMKAKLRKKCECIARSNFTIKFLYHLSSLAAHKTLQKVNNSLSLRSFDLVYISCYIEEQKPYRTIKQCSCLEKDENDSSVV